MTISSCLRTASLQPGGFRSALDAPVGSTSGSTRSQDARGDARSNLFLGAVIDVGQISTPIRIRNISAGGALIQGNDLPCAGTTVGLRRGSCSQGARVIRSDGSRAGVAFIERINVSEWLPRPDQAHQDLTDRRVAAVRDSLGVLPSPSPSLPPTGSTPRLESQELSARFSEELALVSRTLEGIGGDLSNSPLIAGRHLVSLQQLDESARVLLHLASAIASSDPLATIGDIDMQALKRRLLRRSL